jgi:phenylacetic acid degradation operon negative regulatory protein
MRPDNLTVRLPDAHAGDVELMTARPPAPQQLLHRMWDLPAWSDRARHLLEAMAALTPDTPEVLAPGFALSASVLRHLQADPLLPEPLLPARWPGGQLRLDYDEWDARYRATLREWSRA